MSKSPSPRPQRARRGSRTPRNLSEGPSDSEQHANQPRSPRNDRQVQRRHEALGGLLQKGGNQVGSGGQKKEALKLRLDLNLDIEVTIKAKVHGDVTLSLLN